MAAKGFAMLLHLPQTKELAWHVAYMDRWMAFRRPFPLYTTLRCIVCDEIISIMSLYSQNTVLLSGLS